MISLSQFRCKTSGHCGRFKNTIRVSDGPGDPFYDAWIWLLRSTDFADFADWILICEICGCWAIQ